MPEFTHLHCHTQYSLLDGAAAVKKMLDKAVENGMKAAAITDHGNMFGVFDFYTQAKKRNIKPIIGCEFYVVKDRTIQKFQKGNKDIRYHQLMLAKNPEGYKNLSKLCSRGYIEGFYSNYPRIDKELIREHKDGLIATTCCVAAEVPRTFSRKGEEEAEKVFLEWLDIFGEDYYIELQRHGLQKVDEEALNRFLITLSEKHGVKMIATNDSHYVEQEDWDAHDILLCINTGDKKSTPIGDGKNYRFGFENDQFFFKTREEMAELFRDVPAAIENTIEVTEKIEPPDLKRDILLPNFHLPEGFESMDQYLEHLAFKGAKKRYGEVSAHTGERLNHELKIIKDMGYSGYFLIVQDLIAEGKNRNVWVGPGRGSAAGSAVAYCTGITDIDPVKYNLLFERFLNPERVNMPDIDIDFDDDGRQEVINYVVKKYGYKQVAQIITYGTLAARSAIRDVGRVMEYPLPNTDKLAKMVPEGPGVTLEKAIDQNPDLKTIRSQKDSTEAQILDKAKTLEGAIRNRGTHAAGVIIAPDDITNYIPVCKSKDSDLLVTQFDGKLIEDAGMLKMDFLGLKTLSISKYAVKNIQKSTGQKINLEKISLEDKKTFKLYQEGNTVGTFQFESDGMRSWLKQLRPTGMEDLIAMNALYRPGPMEYIPSYIRRKHGEDNVEYPHPWLEDILKPTYGIMVYQEQIMQCAQIIAGFSLGKADILRRAMGKKKKETMQKMKGEFIEGAKNKEIDENKAAEIFRIMEKFAAYGFNRSHSAAYSKVAYQTAYLKANYPAQYMSSVLAHNMYDIKKVIFFIEECRRMGLKVLGPEVNESDYRFSVNENNEIRFGLGAIKGVGESAISAIIGERKNGPYKDLFDLTKRVNLRSVNKKALESLAAAGAFECFTGIHRAQYFHRSGKNNANLIEQAIRYGQKAKELKMATTQSLFGDSNEFQLETPPVYDCEPWPLLETLKKEKELIGFYVSGHPLNDFRVELKNFCIPLEQNNLRKNLNQNVNAGGIVTKVLEKWDKRGRKFGIFGLEDYNGSLEMMLFSDDYAKMKHLLEEGNTLFVRGKVETKYKKDNEYTIRPKEIKFLGDLREKIGTVNIEVDLNAITQDFIGRMESVVKNHKGKCLLKLCISDHENNLHLSMPSLYYKIDPADKLFDDLEKMKEVNSCQPVLNP